MGKKKKKGKKRKASKAKSRQQQFQNLNRDQLLQKGSALIENENPRDAISVLRFAEKRHGKSDDISTLLARSYLMRSSELMEKGMPAEAGATIKRCRDYVKDFAVLSEADIENYVRLSPCQEALDVYKRYLAGNSGSLSIERLLANQLFSSGNWKAADTLNSELPLVRDSAAVREAVPLMNSGDWETALDKMRRLSSRSPFAPVRLFCRAMASFCNEKDEDALRALSMIPDQFPLRGFRNDLKTVLSERNGSKEKDTALSRVGFLWDGPVSFENMIRDILDAAKKGRMKKASGEIDKFAKAVCPADVSAAKAMILQIVSRIIVRERSDYGRFQALVRRTLPAADADLLLARMDLSAKDDPFENTGIYLSRFLKTDFPDPDDEKIAKALILLTKSMFLNNGVVPSEVDWDGVDKYGALMGIESRHLSDIIVDMSAEAVRLDPRNPKAYEFLAQLPRYSKNARKKVETALNVMLDEFPDDPFPCLELASLYYENHAFRKAEVVLGKAMKRAPHDNRVMEKRAISLLVSSDVNIRRGKFHLVEKDIDRAERLDVKKTALYIREKKILAKLVQCDGTFNIADKGQLPLFEQGVNLNRLLEDEIETLPLFEQLRLLSLLVLDIKGPKIQGAKTVSKFLDRVVREKIKLLKSLPSSEIVQLITPPGKEYKPVFANQNVLDLFLKKSKQLLSFIETDEIIPVYDRILKPDLHGIIKKDIRKRLKKTSKKKNRLLLKFYLVTLEHIDYEKDDSEWFEGIINEAGEGPLLEELRIMARRLAKHAISPLKDALEHFDFGILDFDPFGNPFLDDDDDFDDDDFDDDDFDFPDFFDMFDPKASDFDPDTDGPGLGAIVEGAIDDLGLRGAPDTMIRQARDVMNSLTPGMIDMMMDAARMTGIKNKISREARVFLFKK